MALTLTCLALANFVCLLVSSKGKFIAVFVTGFVKNTTFTVLTFSYRQRDSPQGLASNSEEAMTTEMEFIHWSLKTVISDAILFVYPLRGALVRGLKLRARVTRAMAQFVLKSPTPIMAPVQGWGVGGGGGPAPVPYYSKQRLLLDNMIFKPSQMQFKQVNCQISTSFKQFFFSTKTISKTAVADPGGGGPIFRPNWGPKGRKVFWRPPTHPLPPTLFKGSGWLPPSYLKVGSGTEDPWIAIIKTKSATIAFFSSPPVRFSSLFLLFFSFSFAGAGIIELIRRKKPTL